VTLAALNGGVAITDEDAVTRLAETSEINVAPAARANGHSSTVTVNDEDVTDLLRAPEVDRNVSRVSAYPGVRRAMTDQQRRIAARGGVIVAGRDIGTVVLPDAGCKIFLTATPEARARRRMLDRQADGQPVTLDEMIAEIDARDRADSTRAHAPLRAAEDAVWLDNSALSIEETVTRALEIVQSCELRSESRA
jgi:cytidylate kinase